MSAEFVAHMEDVLDLYAEPYDPQRPVVCFDETSTQLLADTRPPLLAQPGRPARQDYEYRREGTRNLFLACEPKAGWRHVAVTERRTMQDFAHQMRWLVDEAYPEVEVVRVVLDNLNTHRTASLYETFPAAEARRIAKRLEFHYTPKHGRTIAKSGSSSVEAGDGLCWAEGAALGSQGHGHPGWKPSFQAQSVQPGVDQGGEDLPQPGTAQRVDVLIPTAVLHVMQAVLNAPVVAE